MASSEVLKQGMETAEYDRSVVALAAERFCAAVEAHGQLWAIGLALVNAISLAIIATRHHLVCDEILVTVQSRLPHWSDIWQAYHLGIDYGPPLITYIVRLSRSLFGDSTLAIRLPSILALTATLYLLFAVTRRAAGAFAGLAAIALALNTFILYHGQEARPYPFYLLEGAIAYWLWTGPMRHSRRGVIAFGVLFFIAAWTHYYTCLLLTPFVFDCLASFRWRRLFEPMLLAGIAGNLLGYASLLPLVLASSRFSKNYWAVPDTNALRQFFVFVAPDALYIATLVMVWIAVSREPVRAALPPMSDTERVGWFCLGLPFAGFLLAIFVTKAFAPKYFIGFIAGAVIGSACWAWRVFQRPRYAWLGFIAILLGTYLKHDLTWMRKPEGLEESGNLVNTLSRDALAEIRRQSPGRQIIFSSPPEYVEAAFNVASPNLHLALEPDDPERKRWTVDQFVVHLGHYLPLSFWRTAEIRQAGRGAWWVNPDMPDVQAMADLGYRFHFQLVGNAVVYVLE